MSVAKLYFTEDHEYVHVDGDVATVGISDYAQQQLGDIVYVECPEVGAVLSSGDEVAVVESVKVASELYTPVSGEVVEINEVLADNPSLVNEDPMENGWFFKIKIADAEELESLKDEATYTTFLEELS